MPFRKNSKLSLLFAILFTILAGALIYIHIYFQQSPINLTQYSKLIIIITSFICFIGLLIASIRSAGEPWFIHTGWLLLMLGFGLDTVGNILDFIPNYPFAFPMYHIFYLVGYSLVAIGILFIPSNPRPQKRRKRQYIDIVVFILVSIVSVWVVLILPYITGKTASLDQAYSALDYLMVFAVLDLLIRRKQDSYQKTGYLLACGVAAIVTGHFLLIFVRNEFRIWINFFMFFSWLIGNAAICLAAVGLEFEKYTPNIEQIEQRVKKTDTTNEFLLPVFWVALAYAILVWSHYNEEIVSFPVLVVGTGSLIFLMIIRLIDALSENARLIEAAHEEINSRKSIQEKLLHDTRHDSLTALPNRAYLIDQLKIALDTARETNTIGSSLFFLDLDNFKLINDQFGHVSGDELLKAFAERLIFCVRPDDFVARLGGDEFAIMLNNLQTSKTVNRVAARIMEKMKEPLEIDGFSHISGVSFGIAYILPTCDSPEEILREADKAMYRAKRKGRNRFEVSGNIDF
jgi:diguanylate cyclase (GGDEF)-like protein